MTRVIALELNELNFEFVKSYVAKGKLPAFARLLRDHPLIETMSESGYPYLEPWIQWPTVYTGKSYDEHGVFRLGDMVGTGHPQIWETLEARGVSVGAISPMNAENRCRHADFFVPDPWTATPVSGGDDLTELAALVSRAVNGNATGASEGLGAADLGRRLLPFLFRFGMASSLGAYLRILWLARKYKWARAVFLDRFLADVFLKLRDRNGTQYASLFLNAGAHIQHHHMFESDVYQGDQVNPAWYSSAKDDGVDPLLFVYEAYDSVLRDLAGLEDTRILISTGLSQKPNPRTIYQYRFIDHARTLAALGVGGYEVLPRMSRDFLLTFADAEAAARAAQRLDTVRCGDGPLFSIENRGETLFCQIAFFGPIEGFADVTVEGETHDLLKDVALVSIENGIHRSVGYHIDTATGRTDPAPGTVPLPTLFDRTLACFGATTKREAIAA